MPDMLENGPLCAGHYAKISNQPSLGWDIGSLVKSRESINMGITRHTYTIQ